MQTSGKCIFKHDVQNKMRGTTEHIFTIALVGGSLLLPWRAWSQGEDPSPLWKPMGPDGSPCPEFGWKYINGTRACGPSCPPEVKSSFFGHCGIGETFGDYVTDGDADTVHTVWLATAGSMATSIGMILVARAAILAHARGTVCRADAGYCDGRAALLPTFSGRFRDLVFLVRLFAGVSWFRRCARRHAARAKIVTSSPLIIFVSIFVTRQGAITLARADRSQFYGP